MQTLKLKSDQAGIAAEIIKKGGLVAVPTETVYGLAADALNGQAVARIFEAKGRPMDNPLIVHISDLKQIYMLVREFPESAKKLAELFWPGPLTMILPKSDRIPDEVSAGLDTVAVRFPSHPVVQEVIRLSSPLAAPSANLSGSPSPTSFRHVCEDMDGRIDAIIDGGDCQVGVESTVITLAEDKPRLLRPGGITLAQLRDTIGEVILDDAVLNPLQDGQKASSPGMKYKHYAPDAEVILVDGSIEQYRDFVNSCDDGSTAAMCYDEDEEGIKIPVIGMGGKEDYAMQAHRIFSLLREADEKGYKRVYAHCPEPEGVGLAVLNRMLRASGFRVIKL